MHNISTPSSKKPEKLAFRIFLHRFGLNLSLGLFVIGFSLFLGMLGYHFLENLSWLDSYLNASMVLAGMGPVDTLKTDLGKLFAGSYALFSGLVFLSVIAGVSSPLIHRILNHFHR